VALTVEDERGLVPLRVLGLSSDGTHVGLKRKYILADDRPTHGGWRCHWIRTHRKAVELLILGAGGTGLPEHLLHFVSNFLVGHGEKGLEIEMDLWMKKPEPLAQHRAF
jgi:hypothetical protein